MRGISGVPSSPVVQVKDLLKAPPERDPRGLSPRFGGTPDTAQNDPVTVRNRSLRRERVSDVRQRAEPGPPRPRPLVFATIPPTSLAEGTCHAGRVAAREKFSQTGYLKSHEVCLKKIKNSRC